MFRIYSILFLFLYFYFSIKLHSQNNDVLNGLHGSATYVHSDKHSGNNITSTFYNDGMYGRRWFTDRNLLWPKSNTHPYLTKVVPLIGAEIINVNGIKKIIVSESHGTNTSIPAHMSSGDIAQNGAWQTFTAIPGYSTYDQIAMTKNINSWPDLWPDKINLSDNPGWPGMWNGYFGLNQISASQESYFIFDDYRNNEFGFYPDSTDSLRRGLGMRVYARGLQWADSSLQDVLFWLYDVENVGTTNFAQINFGTIVGTIMGASYSSSMGEHDDDICKHDMDENITLNYDEDNTGVDGWSPVGYCGFSLLESPGNPYDGIDNDNDGVLGSGDIITKNLFAPVIYSPGDNVIKINYSDYSRTLTVLPISGLTINHPDTILSFFPNVPLVEIPYDNIDNNLNGIIDENRDFHIITSSGDTITYYIYENLKYIDYFTGNGLSNQMIDERRDDGIDNDGDWDITQHDLGIDGAPNTSDFGEGDGVATSGYINNIWSSAPGEPCIDRTDISESDMIGLTAFYNFTTGTVKLHEDSIIWKNIYPGMFCTEMMKGDMEFAYGMGFFPMRPWQTERYSNAIIMGFSLEELLINKDNTYLTYINNYQLKNVPISSDSLQLNFWADVTFGTDSLIVQFIDRSTGDITSWFWDFGDGSTDTLQNPVHLYTTADTFTVSLTVTGPLGKSVYTKQNYIIVSEPVAVKPIDVDAPVEYKLYANYPNPFNPVTHITFSLPEQSEVHITVYNTQGQKVDKIYHQQVNTGIYKVSWNAAAFPSGMYFIQMETTQYRAVRKCLLLK